MILVPQSLKRWFRVKTVKQFLTCAVILLSREEHENNRFAGTVVPHFASKLVGDTQIGLQQFGIVGRQEDHMCIFGNAIQYLWILENIESVCLSKRQVALRDLSCA